MVFTLHCFLYGNTLFFFALSVVKLFCIIFMYSIDRYWIFSIFYISLFFELDLNICYVYNFNIFKIFSQNCLGFFYISEWIQNLHTIMPYNKYIDREDFVVSSNCDWMKWSIWYKYFHIFLQITCILLSLFIEWIV